MRLLITGGCGFIGSNFIRYILNKYPSYTIINLDKLTYCGNPENTRDCEKNQRYSFVQGDVCDQLIMQKAMKDVDVVIHFAAESHVDNSIKDPFIFTKTNVLGTHILLESSLKNKIKKFVYISTDEVYGSIENGRFKETDPLKPSSPYSASKAAADLLAQSFFHTFKLPVIITRSANNFGPYQYPEKVIPLFITNLLENKKVPLYGDGLNVRDWLYVLDNCKAIDFVLHRGDIGEVYNIGAGNEIANLTLTKLILKELGKDESYLQYVLDRPAHDRRYALDWSKLKKLGWKPTFEFTAALKQTIHWYTEQRTWWEQLKQRNLQTPQ